MDDSRSILFLSSNSTKLGISVLEERRCQYTLKSEKTEKTIASRKKRAIALLSKIDCLKSKGSANRADK